MSCVVGISAGYHDSACAVIRDGRLVAAVQEERLSRIKHDPSIPVRAFRSSLALAGADITDVEVLAYYEDPALKAERQAEDNARSRVDPRLHMADALGYQGSIRTFRHHQSHAASAYYCSGFDDAAILTVDGVGERTTTAYWRASDGELELLEEVLYPHSLGLLYSTFTAYLGFSVNDSEYKVMGLAPYGRPRYLERLRRLVKNDGGGQFRLDMQYFAFTHGAQMWSSAFADLVGIAPRHQGDPLEEAHHDLASSIQVLLEEVLLAKVRYLHERVGGRRLCLAGGVALNCVANGRIHREGPFRDLFIQPAAGDAGAAIGAAALGHRLLAPNLPLKLELRDVFLGPATPTRAVSRFVSSLPCRYAELRDDDDDAPLYSTVAKYLAEGRVVGWFRARMEFGPRALGARSIVADPRRPEMRDRINAVVKRREAFRPFAPAVLEDRAGEHFAPGEPSPFMLETVSVRSSLALPSITHVDGSARIQTVPANGLFAPLLRAFDRLTGCPLLLNTSFNMKDEPIVCSAADAFVCFLRSEMDVLVLDRFLIDRRDVPIELIAQVRRSHTARRLGVSEHVYTLV